MAPGLPLPAGIAPPDFDRAGNAAGNGVKMPLDFALHFRYDAAMAILIPGIPDSMRRAQAGNRRGGVNSGKTRRRNAAARDELIYRLRHTEGMSIARIARDVGVSRQSVYAALARHIPAAGDAE